jgi:5S rRNA maturation endonuclease (ribonuclease M5)
VTIYIIVIMLDILSYLPTKRKKTSSEWISFNAVCCTHNNESLDRRGRGGVILDKEHDWRYHCFNCGFTTGFTLGRPVAIKARKLLGWIGVSKVDIDWLNLESLRHRSINDILDDRNKTISNHVHFKEIDLPPTARLITKNDSKFVDYLTQRSLAFDQYAFMITPGDRARNKNRIIIPYTNKGKIVGYTSRFLDNRIPKYLNEQQPGYVFGLDLQNENWKYAIVVEGILDAISIDGIAMLHNEISDIQAQQLKQLYKEVIVVPDHDKAGLKLIDKAIQHGFNVSIPAWDKDIKDVNDAVVRYGKIVTLIGIIENMNSSSLKIKLAKRKLEKKIERI